MGVNPFCPVSHEEDGDVYDPGRPADLPDDFRPYVDFDKLTTPWISAEAMRKLYQPPGKIVQGPAKPVKQAATLFGDEPTTKRKGRRSNKNA